MSISKAFTTNKNNPKVRTVMGKVNKIKMGFTKILSNANIAATTSEVVKFTT